MVYKGFLCLWGPLFGTRQENRLGRNFSCFINLVIFRLLGGMGNWKLLSGKN